MAANGRRYELILAFYVNTMYNVATLNIFIGGFFIFVVTLVVFTVLSITCFAESIAQPQDEISFYISRPNVKLRSLVDDSVTVLHFGDKVNIIENQDELTIVETEDGTTGKVTTAFIVAINYPLIYLDEVGCFLSPMPHLTASDYGYGACGQRYSEAALILFESEGYFFIVTEEGYCGFISAEDPHFILYYAE